jgi:hypothetical protein
MTATCSPLPLILVCQDDPFSEMPRGVDLFPRVCTERLLETTYSAEPILALP